MAFAAATMGATLCAVVSGPAAPAVATTCPPIYVSSSGRAVPPGCSSSPARCAGLADSDGKTDVSVFRPGSSIWYIHGSGGSDSATNFGTTGDIPVPTYYDNNATTDIAVFRPSTGTWYVLGGVGWGGAGDIPVPGDYNGDGRIDTAVFQPSTGVWYVRNGATVRSGGSGDAPLPLPDAIRRFFFTPL